MNQQPNATEFNAFNHHPRENIMKAATSSTETRSITTGWIICMLAALFYCYEFFLRVSPSVMQSTLMQLYHMHATEFGILSGFYYYTYTPMQLFVGTLVDLHGVRKLLSTACAICVIGSYLFIGTHLLWVAKMGRFLIGFGSAFAFVSAMKLAADWLPSKYLALFSGFTTTLGMLGAIFGETILIHVVDHYGWKHAWSLAIIMGIVLTILLATFVRDYEKPASVTLKPREIKGIFNALCIVAKNKSAWTNGIIGSLLFMPVTVFAALWSIPYLHQTLKLSEQQSANITTLMFLGWAIGGPIIGRVSDYIESRKKPLWIGSLISAILISILIYTPHLSRLSISLLFFSFGLSCSVQILVFPVACEKSPHHLAGTAIAFTNMLVTAGGAIFTPLVGVVLDYTWGGQLIQNIPYYSDSSYQIAFTLLPLSLFLSAYLSYKEEDTCCKQQVKDIKQEEYYYD